MTKAQLRKFKEWLERNDLSGISQYIYSSLVKRGLRKINIGDIYYINGNLYMVWQKPDGELVLYNELGSKHKVISWALGRQSVGTNERIRLTKKQFEEMKYMNTTYIAGRMFPRRAYLDNRNIEIIDTNK